MGIPTIKGTIRLNKDEVLKGTFFINTGAGTTLDFNTPFSNKHDIIHKTGEHYSYLVKDISNNETLHYEGRVKTLSFDGFDFSELPIGISQVNQGIQANGHVSGIIGNKLLRKFNILFDYPNHKLYFEKSKYFDDEVSVNCSGMDIQMNEDMSAVLIHQIIADSPASNLGINVNDELVSINGKKAMDLSLVEIEQMLKKAGETVTIQVRRKGPAKEYKLELKSLL